MAIVGSGFAGTLLAINVLRHDGPRATLIERGPRPGRGVAYGTSHARLILNVRAANMSAFPDDPGHFLRWLAARGIDAPDAFVPRRLYGEYLAALLAEAKAAAGDRLRIVQGDIVDLAIGPGGIAAQLADGRRIAADRAALAVGNLPPHMPAACAALAAGGDVYVADPWTTEWIDGLGSGDTVFVLGTGLTMVDTVLLLDEAGFEGRVVALSRRGLLPRTHAGAGVPAPTDDVLPTSAAGLLQRVRRRSAQVGWRGAVDELRPATQRIWRAMDDRERARFLRHLRPWWDVHRHRIAPQVADRLAALQAMGRLAIVAGRMLACERARGIARVDYRPRGAGDIRRIDVARVVNATGPQGSLSATREPLLRNLVERGHIRADPLGIGIDVDQESCAIATDGTPSGRLIVLGPMTRGAFWEIVAVPEIRRQTWSVARALSHAQWVEGEGL